jgi:hypothetical protein
VGVCQLLDVVDPIEQAYTADHAAGVDGEAERRPWNAHAFASTYGVHDGSADMVEGVGPASLVTTMISKSSEAILSERVYLERLCELVAWAAAGT